MPTPIVVELKFDANILPPSGRRARSGSIAGQVKTAAVGSSVFLTEKSHVTSFISAVKHHRPECRVQTASWKEGDISGTRCWILSAAIQPAVDNTQSTAVDA